MIHAENFKTDLASYQSKQFSNDWLDEIYARKLFKLFLPKNLDGHELNLSAGLEQFISAASIHGSLGWNINLGNGAAYFYRFFKEETATKLFSDRKAVIAGSGITNGKAIQTDNGFFISGNWDKCSGSAHATACTGNTVFEDGKAHSFLILKEQIKTTDTWNMFAMKATSSFTFSAENAFIHTDQIFDIGILKHEDSYVLSEIPFEIFARLCMLATVIGTVECFLNHLENEFQHRIRSFENEYKNLRKKISSDKSSMLQLADRYWKIAETKSAFTEHHTLNLSNGISLTNRSLFDASCDLFFRTGISLADEKQLAHHAFKDVLIACQHGMMKA